MLELLLANEYSTLILVDFLRGIYSWGLPSTWSWGTWCVLYLEEFIFWWIFPLVSMLWWRSWSKKHPELLEEI